MAQQEKQLPEPLLPILRHITDGLIKRYGYDIDEEVAGQEFVVLVIHKIHRIDPERNAFSYLTTTARNMMFALLRSKAAYSRLIDKASRLTELPEC